MNRQSKESQKGPDNIKHGGQSSAYNLVIVIFVLTVVGAAVLLRYYNPAPQTPQPPISFEQKMAYLETGVPLPQQQNKPQLPRWMIGLILVFVFIQILPLLIAARKARSEQLSRRDLRQIEYLTETPLFLGLLGSLLGVCMTQFMTGSLAAPLAYLTTISGILLYLLGRFTISVSVPSTNDLMI